MKKITPLILVLFAYHQSFAQPAKGSMLIGGSLQFNSNRNEPSTESYSQNNIFSIAPQAGKFIKDGLAIGAIASYGRTTSKSYANPGTQASSTNNVYGIGIFVRKYYPLAGKLFFYGEAVLSGNIISGHAENAQVSRSKNSGWGSALGITPGIAFKTGKKVWLEAALNNLLLLNYGYQKNETFSSTNTLSGTTKSKSFNGSANLNCFNNIAVGIRWII